MDIRRTGIAVFNVFLITLNFIAFIYELSLSPRQSKFLFYTFGLVPAHTQLFLAPHGIGLGKAFLPVLTSMFLHGGWLHLLGNMLFLWVFGGAVEEFMGHIQYLTFYLISGIGAAAAHLFFNWGSTVPTIGASGAISGVMGAFIVLYPRAKVTTLIPALFLFFTVRIPAILMLGYWLLIQFISGITSLGIPGQGGVAWWAHIGGFLLGAMIVIVMRRR